MGNQLDKTRSPNTVAFCGKKGWEILPISASGKQV